MFERYSLDARGLFCPEPVMMLHQQFRKMTVGDELEVICTDPSTQRDIPKFCTFLEHELLSQHECEGEFVYLLKKCHDG